MLADSDNTAVTEPEASELDVAESRPEEKPLKLQVSDLVEDARTLALAEVEYYKTKLTVNMAATKTVLGLFGVAITMALTAIVALILGLLLIADNYLGPIAATGIVTGAFILIAAILGKMAISRVRKLPLSENSDE
ncbi:MAG: phage holin family protein [Parasphingorhabdus sp.]